ncbi:hypothetical protein [Meiothermus rufus]|uniref:hypothetical protein n=1 Tax=Meiothermus rufus TaxID=604332 RepID=UPI00041845EF|nr:hypothetical protein [Meiothermus rufus]
MRRTLIPLLALLLLGAACNQRTAPPPPPPPVQDPDPLGPLRLSLQDFTLVLDRPREMSGLSAQLYAGPSDGSWLEYMTNFWPYQDARVGTSITKLRLREGRVEVYAEDRSYNKVYGGRRFRWVYRFRIDDSGFPPRLVFPDGPVAYEVLERFPWGDQWPGDDSVRGRLQNVAVGGGFQVCIRQRWTPPNETLEPGLWGAAFQKSGSPGPHRTPYQPNFIFTYMWQDGEFMGRPGIQGEGELALGDPGSGFSNRTYFDDRPHSAVLISKSLNLGEYPQPWEGRWFRSFNRGFGAYQDPSAPGGVRCEFGEGWQVEEVTDPAEVALLEEYQSTRGKPNYQQLPPYPLFSRLDPRLCPTPWRQPDGSCKTLP